MAVSMSEDKYIDVFHPIARLFPFFIFRHFTFYIGNFSRREYISSFLTQYVSSYFILLHAFFILRFPLLLHLYPLPFILW